MTPHKHAALIKAWADGAQIQLRLHSDWIDIYPMWRSDEEYRIKPEPKPDAIKTAHILLNTNGDIWQDIRSVSNVRFTFDGETGKLKSAEVLSA